jgi:DNA-binding NarL/FixJ family response regulator
MRKTRVLYLEGDAALRSMMSKEIRRSALLELVFSGPSLNAAIDFGQKGVFDVALVETRHGEWHSGQEIVSILRGRDSNCGIVFYSQEPSTLFLNRLLPDEKIAISVLQKRDPVDFELLFKTLVRTAEGYSSFDIEIVGDNHIDNLPDAGLTIRDNAIMRMLADGKNTEFIARTLNLAQVTVRQELCKVYRLLIPNRTEGSHLRTLAVAAYLERIKQDTPHKTDAGVRITSAADEISRPADLSLSK